MFHQHCVCVYVVLSFEVLRIYISFHARSIKSNHMLNIKIYVILSNMHRRITILLYAHLIWFFKLAIFLVGISQKKIPNRLNFMRLSLLKWYNIIIHIHIIIIHNNFKVYKNILIENKFLIYNLLCINKILVLCCGLSRWQYKKSQHNMGSPRLNFFKLST
jgi:hypothetical protein